MASSAAPHAAPSRASEPCASVATSDASVCHKVLLVPELAEAIFLALPMRDVLCNIQRTCRVWNDIVDWSLPIQEALFFRPVIGHPVKLAYTLRYDEDLECFQKPLYKKVKGPLIESPIFSSLPVHKLDAHNPIWTRFARPDASWRRQLVCQPPISHVALPTGGPRDDFDMSTERYDMLFEPPLDEQVYACDKRTMAMPLRLEDLKKPAQTLDTLAQTYDRFWECAVLDETLSELRYRMFESLS